MEAISFVLTGFAFFLLGLKFFSNSLSQVTGDRFSYLIAKFTPNNTMAGLWGAILSQISAGNMLLISCIAAGMRTIGAISLEKALLILNWSRVGSASYIYLAGFNIKLAIMIVLGLAGIAFALNRPKKYVPLASSIFNLSLVLFGIQMIKGATKPLAKLDWFQAFIDMASQEPVLYFFVGFLFLIFTQSFFGAMVIGLSFIEGEILSLHEAIIFTCGSYLGIAVTKLFYLLAFEKDFRRVISFLSVYYGLCTLLSLFFYLLELWGHLPLLTALASSFSDSPKIQLAHINLFYHLITATLLSFCMPSICSWIGYFFGKVDQDQQDKERFFIPEQMLDHPEITFSLLYKEIHSLSGKIRELIAHTQREKSWEKSKELENAHKRIQKRCHEIREIFSQLVKRSAYESVSKSLLEEMETHNHISNLAESAYCFCKSIDKMKKLTFENAHLQETWSHFVEAYDVLCLMAQDVLEKPSTSNLSDLRQVTSDRGELMRQIRDNNSMQIATDQQIDLLEVIHHFESSIWILRKLSFALKPVP